MATTEALSSADLAERGDFEYRPLNMGAIASAVFGVLSTLVFVAGRDSLESALLMAPLPLIGIALGVRSLVQIRRFPDHASGAGLAAVGIGLSAACLVGGMAFAGYVRATEVPSGYVRTSFEEMKPDDVDLRGSHLVPPDVAALEGKKVFIKGYMRPGTHYSSGGSAVNQNIKQFLLVRDDNQCCFGDLSSVQFYDQIAVTMTGDLTTDYKRGLYRMGGTLHIRPENAANGSSLPVYILAADHVE